MYNVMDKQPVYRIGDHSFYVKYFILYCMEKHEFLDVAYHIKNANVTVNIYTKQIFPILLKITVRLLCLYTLVLILPTCSIL